ncbi:MAG: sulfatase [Zavarzinella sp.]
MPKFFAALLAIWLFLPPQAWCEKPKPPNIVLIFTDDLGWKDVGYQGSDFHETPHIDNMAKQGMVFSNAYSCAGNCAPSRACLLSGQYTPRHHVFAVGSTNRGPAQQMRLIPIPNKSGLAKENLTMAAALQQAGYQTGIFGKWHLSGPEGRSPAESGFQVVFDSRAQQPNQKRNIPDDPKGAFSLTQAACEFMTKNREKPFFCYLAHHAIHSALEAKPDTLEKFRKKTPGKQHNSPIYAACLYDLDTTVGLVLAKLKELKIEDNTLVIFTSDNGGTQQSSQEPLRGSKGGYYEGGIREPFIAYWPGKILAGQQCAVPVNFVDLYPTFLAAAGAQTPKNKQLDGTNILPLLQGEKNFPVRPIFWHFPGYLDTPVIRGRDPVFRTRPVSVVRKGDWKLHLYHEEWVLDGGFDKRVTNNSLELYHISNDIGERTNLVGKEPEKRDELLKDLLTWWDAIKAPIPSQVNPKFGKKGKNKN